ncbi:MAG: hypothetical protein COB45_04935 [Gammaproteobacteria bacterium]|nr:MAG: hypothetical protein COB45_04935 [Gammaproteobacteria bacterium]PHR82728.1 MAG: hypothetical protein COA59_13940 [Colwellia sp.]
MDTIDTISQLLHTSNSQFRLYDIGRKIEKIPKALFEKIELNQVPYPTPSQGHACIAIVFWQKKTPQPFLWLLKLPLDERGLLNQGARNHFIAIIIEALGDDLTQNVDKDQEALLKNNPYLYTPAQYKLAALNSKIKFELKQAPSEHLAPFVSYITGDNGWDNWQAVGVQGITDFAVRIREETTEKYSEILVNALPHLPHEVLLPLCGALENEVFSVDLINALLNLFKEKLRASPKTDLNVPLQQYLLRSLASNCQHVHVDKLVSELLQQQNISNELLIILSGRCWLALVNNEQLMAFLEHLVSSDDQALFNSVFKDLVSIPVIRPIVFQCMRSPERSDALSKAIGQLFN